MCECAPVKDIAILATSHNRRELTLRTIESLGRQRSEWTLNVETFLVDDGSTDGTGDAVANTFPEVHILRGDGTLFWNGGMRVAFDSALKKGFDAYIFLNDDTILYEDALSRIIQCAETWSASHGPAIVVGSTRSPGSGKHTYGGYVRRTKGLKIWFEMVEPHATMMIPCETMNCNFVLIPAEIANVVGNLEPRFRHQFGDLDYGFRAKQAGFDVVVAPGFIGECEENAAGRQWRNSRNGLGSRWKSLRSPKGVPFGEWILYARRHFGWRWLPYALSPYIKTFFYTFLPGSSHSNGKPEDVH